MKKNLVWSLFFVQRNGGAFSIRCQCLLRYISFSWTFYFWKCQNFNYRTAEVLIQIRFLCKYNSYYFSVVTVKLQLFNFNKNKILWHSRCKMHFICVFAHLGIRICVDYFDWRYFAFIFTAYLRVLWYHFKRTYIFENS